MPNDAAPPNVLWILSDELRTDALGCYGNASPEVSTPAIDALAAQGVTFERNYAASPICVPSRTAMLTGLNPVTSGVLGNEAYGASYKPMTTWPEVLADGGWTTASFGKAHVPASVSAWQMSDPAGSDMREHLAAARDAGAEIRRTPDIGHVFAAILPEGTPLPGDLVTRNTVRALAGASGRFVIRASYLQPHRPMVVPQPWAHRYDGVEFPVDPSPEHAPNRFERRFGEVNKAASMSPSDVQLMRQQYYAAVAWFDDQVRQLLEALERHGLAESTIVVLTSDHGAHLGEFGAIGKHTFAPESHRTPLIVRWPGVLPAGARRGDLTTCEDLARTMTHLCGVASPPAWDGRPLFSPDAPPPDAITSVIGYGLADSKAFPNRHAGTWDEHSGWPQRVCVRTARYRYERNTRIDGHEPSGDQKDEFFADCFVDPAESTNRSGDERYQSVVGRLAALVDQAAAALTVAPVPPAADSAMFGAV